MTRTTPDPVGLPRGATLIADPNNIGWPMVLIFTLSALLDLTVGFGSRESGAPFAWNFIEVLASLTAIFSVLWVAKMTYLRTSFARHHVSVTVITMFIAVFIGTRLSQWIISELAETSENATPIGSDRILFGTVALVTIAWIVGSLRAYRSAASELQTARQRLIIATSVSQERLHDERDLVVAPIAATLRDLVDTLPSISAEEGARRLRVTATEIVRPTSHELIARTTPIDFPDLQPVPRPPWRQTLAQVAVTPLVLPKVMAITLVLLISRLSINEAAETPSSPRTPDVTVTVDWSSLGRALVQLAVVFMAVWLPASVAARILSRVLPNRRPRVRWLLTLISIPLVAGIAQIMILTAFSIPALSPDTSSSLRNPLLFVSPLILIAVITTIVRTARTRLIDILRDLHDENTEFGFALARLNEQLWLQRRSLSKMLHGPLQGTLNSAALRITQAADSSAIDPLIDVVPRIERAIIDLETNAPEHVDVAQELSLIEDTWRGVCTIDLQLASTTLKRIHDDPLCATSFIDIVGEAIANAVIHAGAHTITITVLEHGSREIRIDAIDDGTGLTERDGGGLGSQLLREACTEWGLTSQDGRTHLFAVMPIAAATSRT